MEFSQKMLVSPVFEEMKRQSINPGDEKIHLALILYSSHDSLAKLFQCDADLLLSENGYVSHNSPTFYSIGTVQSVSIKEKILFLIDGKTVAYQYLIKAKAAAYSTVEEEVYVLRSAFGNFMKNYRNKLPLPKQFVETSPPQEKRSYSIQKEDIKQIKSPPAIAFSDKSLDNHITFALYI